MKRSFMRRPSDTELCSVAGRTARQGWQAQIQSGAQTPKRWTYAGIPTPVSRIRHRPGNSALRQFHVEVRPRQPVFLQRRPVQHRCPALLPRRQLRPSDRAFATPLRHAVRPGLQGHPARCGHRHGALPGSRAGCGLVLQSQGGERPRRRRHARRRRSRGKGAARRRCHHRRHRGARIGGASCAAKAPNSPES